VTDATTRAGRFLRNPLDTPVAPSDPGISHGFSTGLSTPAVDNVPRRRRSASRRAFR